MCLLLAEGMEQVVVDADVICNDLGAFVIGRGDGIGSSGC